MEPMCEIKGYPLLSNLGSGGVIEDKLIEACDKEYDDETSGGAGSS